MCCLDLAASVFCGAEKLQNRPKWRHNACMGTEGAPRPGPSQMPLLREMRLWKVLQEKPEADSPEKSREWGGEVRLHRRRGLGTFMLMDISHFSLILKDRGIIFSPGPDSKTSLIDLGPRKHISLGKKSVLKV